MKIAFVCNDKEKFYSVYDEKALTRLGKLGECRACISSDEFSNCEEYLRQCEVIFSTWGMPSVSEAEIKRFFPNVKALFYSAGTVQDFAEPFLSSGIKVFSAFAANAVPVAEYTVAQIVLAAKGYFQSEKIYHRSRRLAAIKCRQNYGNYEATVGLVGLGAIGKSVAQKLKLYDISVIAYDPFVSAETADNLGVKLVDIETLFRESDIISNHLANKKELTNFYDKRLFSLMKSNATFINTGRGAQVNEKDLAKALKISSARTAIVDVIKNETKPYRSSLFYCRNAIMTPHIAGSTGHEVARMAKYMIDEAEAFISGSDTKYEITAQMLKTMA